MIGRRGAYLARWIGRGGRNGAAKRTQNLPGHRVCRRSDGHGIKSRRHKIGQGARPARYHNGQRPGPERRRQSPCPRGQFADLSCGFHIRNMDDQRVELWPLLGRKNRRHCLMVACVSSQTINRFRWQSEKTTRPQHIDRARDTRRVSAQTLGFDK